MKGTTERTHPFEMQLTLTVPSCKKWISDGYRGPPVEVRNHDASHVQVADGPYMVSTLPVAGFALIEAASIAEAIKMVSQTPCAVACGVVEVWPLE